MSYILTQEIKEDSSMSVLYPMSLPYGRQSEAGMLGLNETHS